MSANQRARRSQAAVRFASLSAVIATATVLAATAWAGTAPGPSVADQDWQTYHSLSGAFTVAFPPDWSVQDNVDDRGATMVALASGDGASAIAVRAAAGGADNADLPNTLCSTVTVAGLIGSRCIDTLGRSLVVTLNGGSSDYQLVTARRGDSSVFEQVLASFVPDNMPDTTPSPSASPTAGVVPGDPCTGYNGRTKNAPLCPMP
ncbi:MAG: hypothetical protein ACR2IK_08660 [Chloroflexota bacterium]